MRSELDKALGLLGVGYGATKQEVIVAFRKAVKAAHPDSGGLVGMADMGKLVEAKELVLRHIDLTGWGEVNQSEESPCKMCGGRGRVGAGFGAECTACRGTGQQP